MKLIDSVGVYWDPQFLTDCHIPHKKPDVLWVGKAGCYAYIIDDTNLHNSDIVETRGEEGELQVYLYEKIKEFYVLRR